MAVTGAIAAVVGAGYGVYAGERNASEGRKGRRRQAQAQRQAMTQKTSTAARARGREQQTRIGQRLAMANQARVGGAMRAPGVGTGATGTVKPPTADVAATGKTTFG